MSVDYCVYCMPIVLFAAVTSSCIE
jgi:hypothetical protein